MPPIPQSPPKRLTRARAKAVQETKAASKATAASIPLTKAAPSRLVKRKGRAAEEEKAPSQRHSDGQDPLPEPAKVSEPQTTSKAAAPASKAKRAPQQDEREETATKRPRGRPRKNPGAATATGTESEQSVPPIRNVRVGPGSLGRSAATGLNAPPLKKRVTFEVGESEKENNVRQGRQTTKRRAGEDKTQSTPKASALNVGPLRRPPATSKRGKKVQGDEMETKGKLEPLSPKKDDQVSNKNTSKTNALADEDDDMDDGKPPRKASQQSPVKQRPSTQKSIPGKVATSSTLQSSAINSQRAKSGEPVDELQLPSEDLTSPNKNSFGPSISQTPARRLPQSAIKNMQKGELVTLNETVSRSSDEITATWGLSSIAQSPKKFPKSTLQQHPVFEAPSTSNIGSFVYGSPARRPAPNVQKFVSATAVKPSSSKPDLKSSLFGTPARRPPSPSKGFGPKSTFKLPPGSNKSTLMGSPPRRPPSPQRGRAPGLNTTATPGGVNPGSSLFGSPARRPLVAYKQVLDGRSSEVNSATSVMSAMNESAWTSTPRKPTLSPGKTVVSALRGKRSPEASAKVHKMSPEEQAKMLEDELVGAPSPFTPWKRENDEGKGRKCVTEAAQTDRNLSPQIPMETPTVSPPKDLAKFDEDQHMADVERSTTPPGLPSKLVGPAFEFSSRAHASHLDGDESEDELQSEAPQLDTTPVTQHGRNHLEEGLQYTPTPAHYGRTPKSTSGKESMTALTKRFNEWQGASPDKNVIQQRNVGRSIFSPIVLPARPIELQATTTVTPSTEQQEQSYVKTAIEHQGPNPVNRELEHKHVDRPVLSPIKFATSALDSVEGKNASPERKINNGSNYSILSPRRMSIPILEDVTMFMLSPEKPSHFEEAMAIREDSEDMLYFNNSIGSMDGDLLRNSQISDASQEYGDENAIPIDAVFPQSTVILNKAFTPSRVLNQQPKVIHTVSKVPLKPAADFDESPLARPLRRSHSLSGALSPRTELDLQALRQIHPCASNPANDETISSVHLPGSFNALLEAETMPPRVSTTTPSTPGANSTLWSTLGTPARTPRADLNRKLLSGCVVFVDVHTTEGADASGIFIDLLTQMGARCIKHWAWNPRGSVASGSPAGDQEEAGSTRVGISHVVFKDGGRRTMEKVREAKGVVMCVGVGWVLDCERENKWLEESAYAVDTSNVPRGGHRRRKSMEPKALAHLNVGADTVLRAATMSSTKEFLNLSSSPACTTLASPINNLATTPQQRQGPSTHDELGLDELDYSIEGAKVTVPLPSDAVFSSPTTEPSLLSPARLVQQTCPPKQMQQPLFLPRESGATDGGDEGVRRRLELVRRKSLQWAPRVGSPLRGALG